MMVISQKRIEFEHHHIYYFGREPGAERAKSRRRRWDKNSGSDISWQDRNA